MISHLPHANDAECAGEWRHRVMRLAGPVVVLECTGCGCRHEDLAMVREAALREKLVGIALRRLADEGTKVSGLIPYGHSRSHSRARSLS